MKRLLIPLTLLLFTHVAQSDEVLRLHGSNTIGAKLAPVLAEQWLKSKGYSRVTMTETAMDEKRVDGQNSHGQHLAVEIKAHGSATAFADLANGATDIGMASRPIKPEEVVKLSSLGKLDDVRSEYVIGLDGVAVIVNSANPLAKMDKSVLRSIFDGETTNWSQLGGNPGTIRVLARDNNSGTWDTFKHLVLTDGAKLLGAAARYESSTELVSKVAADPNAIGFVGLAYTQGVKTLAISDGGVAIAPTPFTVATEDYALSRRLFLYVPAHSDKWALSQEFADYVVSHTGQQVLLSAEFISQSIEAQPVVHGQGVPAEYAKLTAGAERLSLNFRFDRGSSLIDNKAKRDISRLANYLSRPENSGRRLMLFGFADKNESLPIKSLALSIERADAVADLLIHAGLIPYRVRGYGSDVTLAANDSESGRHRNRRVEVWVQ